MRVSNLPTPVAPSDSDLADLEARVRYGLGHKVGKGQPTPSAQWELDRLATQMLKGQTPHLRGNYSIADKYADRPSFSNRPYRTSARYASGKAGRRSVGRSW